MIEQTTIIDLQAQSYEAQLLSTIRGSEWSELNAAMRYGC